MVGRKFIYYDLEEHPLEIKTDSRIGSGDILCLVVYRIGAGNIHDSIGNFQIKFSSPIVYKVSDCQDWTSFTETPSATLEQIWKFTKTSTFLIVHSNDVKVVDFRFDTAACASKWSEIVGKISFIDDTASDKYRKTPTCDVSNFEVESGTLPVFSGTVITVKCRTGFTLEGDSVITCIEGNEIIGSASCQISEERNYLDINIIIVISHKNQLFLLAKIKVPRQ